MLTKSERDEWRRLEAIGGGSRESMMRGLIRALDSLDEAEAKMVVLIAKACELEHQRDTALARIAELEGKLAAAESKTFSPPHKKRCSCPKCQGD